MKTKKLVFKGVCCKVIYSGQEAENLEGQDYLSYDGWLDSKVPILEGVEGYNAVPYQSGRWRRKSTAALRKKMTIPTSRSTMRKRRLTMMKTYVQHPETAVDRK